MLTNMYKVKMMHILFQTDPDSLWRNIPCWLDFDFRLLLVLLVCDLPRPVLGGLVLWPGMSNFLCLRIRTSWRGKQGDGHIHL